MNMTLNLEQILRTVELFLHNQYNWYTYWNYHET